MGTWAQVRRGQCWVQTLLPLRQWQLSQASCHSVPGCREWNILSVSTPQLVDFSIILPPLNPAWVPSQGKGLGLEVATVSWGRGAFGAQRLPQCWGATCCPRP